MKSYLLLLSLASALVASAFARGQGDLEDVRNFHRVSDVLLTAGQIYPEQVAALQSENVELIINLAVADPKRNAQEPFAVAAAGISYVNIPVLWDSPTPRDLDLFFAMMDARQGRKTLVHCFANFRASAFTYLYRVIREGVPEAEAREDLYAVWDAAKFDENPIWRAFIADALKAAEITSID
ncbi:protein tyrosine phosphatase family protein [Congregibacter variabilis]|uniref:Protein tyrosine phosphatase family protein n=1 Tax=Congregibacter variabilis TaxID=3081200 RepID=A0ABZ0I7Z6_9GAMM|nr:protein tyrosine phosphatase family protein [Congregibacter sp. IMCC43200]